VKHIGMIVFVLGILALPAWGQDRTAISGTVTDSSGAMAPGVKVELNSPATGLSREAVTGATGIYEFPALPIGSYKLTMSKPGFKPFEVDGVDLLYRYAPSSGHRGHHRYRPGHCDHRVAQPDFGGSRPLGQPHAAGARRHQLRRRRAARHPIQRPFARRQQLRLRRRRYQRRPGADAEGRCAA
jgi:hypothetical protein